MLVVIFLVPINFLISFRMYSTPKVSKYVTLLPFTYKAIERVPTDLYSSRFITYVPSFILGKLFLEKAQLN